jgi:hypothetical protein
MNQQLSVGIRYENDETSAESEVPFNFNDITKAKEFALATIEEWFQKVDTKYVNHVLITCNGDEYWNDIETDMLGQPGVFDCRKLTKAQQRMVERFINHVTKRDA